MLRRCFVCSRKPIPALSPFGRNCSHSCRTAFHSIPNTHARSSCPTGCMRFDEAVFVRRIVRTDPRCCREKVAAGEAAGSVPVGGHNALCFAHSSSFLLAAKRGCWRPSAVDVPRCRAPGRCSAMHRRGGRSRTIRAGFAPLRSAVDACIQDCQTRSLRRARQPLPLSFSPTSGRQPLMSRGLVAVEPLSSAPQKTSLCSSVQRKDNSRESQS